MTEAEEDAGPPGAFLDACVLFPPLVRTVLLETASAGIYRPYWSPRVLDEWRVAVARQYGIAAEASVEEARADMTRRFPDAEITPPRKLTYGLNMPDPGDIHVVAAAKESPAGLIVTFNMRHFPRRAIKGQKLEARHPDSFLWEMFDTHRNTMIPAVQSALVAMGTRAYGGRAALKRAQLPRLAKAWEEFED